jgi:nitrite reductase/ring-hydroxylating ferredoxin subunit
MREISRKGMIHQMKTKVVVIALAVLALLGAVVAVGYIAYGRAYCGGGVRSCHRAGANLNETASAIRPTWIDATVEGDSVSIPVSQIESDTIVNFRVTYQGTDMASAAYKLGEQIYVRTALCPPCRSESFSLDGDVLDCDTCHTRFSATTGDGLKGACRAYRKAEVQYSVAGDKVTMSIADLVTAYQDTKNPG